MLYRQHFSVYCINVAHKRIDILDSLDYKTVGTDFSEHHNEELMQLMLTRLAEAFQKISKRFPNFSTWRRCQYRKAPVMKHANDCAVLAFRFTECYDGNKMVLSSTIDPVSLQPANAPLLSMMHMHCIPY